MSYLVTRAAAIVAQLAAAGITATADPTRVAGAGPVVFVAPPRLTLAGDRTATWSLYALAGSTRADAATFATLADLLDQVDDVFPLQSAAPASWAPTPGTDPMPAYLLTIEDSI